MAFASAETLPYIENGLPFVLSEASSGFIHHQSLSSVIATVTHQDRQLRNQDSARKSSTRSVSSRSSGLTSSPAPLRLADVAKQHAMGIHTEAWREEIQPVRQYLPMQHIIGSLKRDRDEQADFCGSASSNHHRANRRSMHDDFPAASPESQDFLHMLRTPKRRRTFDNSHADSPATPHFNSDWRFNFQAYDQAPKEVPRSALPGLNHVLSLSTVTPSERDVFSEYTPQDLEDPHNLMNEVLRLREVMMDDEPDDDNLPDLDDTTSTLDTLSPLSPIVPPEREIEVRKAFEEFIDYSDSKRYIAKI